MTFALLAAITAPVAADSPDKPVRGEIEDWRRGVPRAGIKVE